MDRRTSSHLGWESLAHYLNNRQAWLQSRSRRGNIEHLKLSEAFAPKLHESCAAHVRVHAAGSWHHTVLVLRGLVYGKLYR